VRVRVRVRVRENKRESVCMRVFPACPYPYSCPVSLAGPLCFVCLFSVTLRTLFLAFLAFACCYSCVINHIPFPPAALCSPPHHHPGIFAVELTTTVSIVVWCVHTAAGR